MRYLIVMLLIFSPMAYASLADQDQNQRQQQGQHQGQQQGQVSSNTNSNANLSANINKNLNINSARSSSQSNSQSSSNANANGLGIGVGIGKGGDGGDGGNAKSKSSSYSEGSTSHSRSEGGDSDSRSRSSASGGASSSGVDYYQGDTVLSVEHEYEAVAEAVSSLNLPACGDGGGASHKDGSFNVGGVAYLCEIEMEIRLQMVSIAAEIAGARRSKDPEMVQYHLNNAHERIEDIKHSVDDANDYIDNRSYTATLGAWFRDTWWVMALLAIGL